MAIVKRQILGSLSGGIGDVVYKYNKGTSYTSIRPKKYKKTKSPDLIKSRIRFSKRVAFCKFILQSPLLKLVWKTAKVPGKYAYHKIFKYNFHYIKDERLHPDIYILPDNYGLNFNNFHLDENSLSYDFLPDKKICDNFVGSYYFIALIYMYSPVDENSMRKEVLISLEEEAKDFVPVRDQLNHFDFKIQKSSFEIMNDFQKIMVFPALVSYDKKQKLAWAESICKYVKGERDVAVPIPKVDPPKLDEPYRSFIVDVK